MKQLSLFLLFAAWSANPAIYAQSAAAPAQGAVLNDTQVLTLYTRGLQLMESAGYAIPNLTQSAAPLTEMARQSVESLKTQGVTTLSVHYRFLNSLRSYLLLADAVPKPNPYPAEARNQVAELRDTLTQAEANFEALMDRLQRDLSNPDRDNLARYQEANGRAGSPAAGRPRVVFLGDSITNYWRLNEYFPDRDFHNRGISGQITGQMLGRFQADVVNLRPAAVLVLAGTNDIARGVPLSAIRNNLTMMADLAAANKINILFATILPVSDYHRAQNPRYERTKTRPPATIVELNNWLTDFCRRRGLVLVNYYSAVVDNSGFLKAELARDGLHPDAGGYRLMAPVALAAVDKALAPQTPAQQQGRKRRLF